MRLFVVGLLLVVVVCGRDHTIPQLDLNIWYHGNEEQKHNFAADWDEAFHTYGFCILVNHKVASTHPLYEGLKDFFSLPQEEKEKYTSLGNIYGPGYHPYGQEKQRADGQKLADLNENYQFYASEADYNTLVPSKNDSPPGLFELVNTYYQDNLALLLTIMDINDAALSLPKGTFRDLYFEHGYLRALRLTNYFELKDDDDILDNDRIGPHTDYSGFTLLKADHIPGLEVAVGETHFDTKDLKMAFDEWVPVPFIPDSIIINAGDMIRYFTNGHWKSAYHRVRASKPQRISLVFFTGPGLLSRTDTRIEFCEICKNEEKRFNEIQMTLEKYLVWRASLSSQVEDITKEEL